MRIVVTRPADQAQALVTELQRRGAAAVALPLIDILPADDVQPLQQAWRELPQLACVMFVSANAVGHFMTHKPPGLSWPALVLAASTGPGTSAALRAAGISSPVLVEPAGEVFDSEALWLQLKARPWARTQVMVVRGDEGRDWLAEQWRAAGAQVRFVTAYRRQLPTLDSSARAVLHEALARPAEHLWMFSSSQALANLRMLAPAADWSASRAVASHARIADAANRLGFGEISLQPVQADPLLAWQPWR